MQAGVEPVFTTVIRLFHWSEVYSFSRMGSASFEPPTDGAFAIE